MEKQLAEEKVRASLLEKEKIEIENKKRLAELDREAKEYEL